MSSPDIDWAGDAALHALGRLPDGEVASFESETASSPHRAQEFAELRSVARLLDLVEVDGLGLPPSPDRGLQERLVAAVARSRHDRRRSFRRRIGAAVAGAAAAVLIVGGVLVLTRDDSSTEFVEFDVGSEQAGGRYAFEPNDLGTSITLEVTGLDRSELYWLWLSDATGVRNSAGTFVGSGDDSSVVVLQSGLDLADATRIWVTDEADGIILDGRIGGE